MFDPHISAVDLARHLIGAELVVRGAGGTIVETEAYAQDDPASHSFQGANLRNAAMFGAAGHVYVYRSYGIHLCLNVVARSGEAVLIRALQPNIGVAAMALRRGRTDLRHLCSGPGKLGQALGITLADNGQRFTGGDFVLRLQNGVQPNILVGPRIGISRAIDLPWRFGLAGSAWLSRPF